MTRVKRRRVVSSLGPRVCSALWSCSLAPSQLPYPAPRCSGARTPNPVLLAGCARIYGGEVVIDIIKHAVLGKFNEIR